MYKESPFCHTNPNIKWNDETFKHLIKNSFDIFVLLDENGNQQFVSESCEKILGYKPNELIDIPVIDQMIHPDDQENTRTELLKMINGTSDGGAQYRHRHKNGGWVYLEAFGSNQLQNPNIRSIILNVRDITERKKVEKALEESQNQLKELIATKDKFFSIIAHDLISPFNSILGLSDLIESNLNENNISILRKYNKIINSSSKQTLNLLTNLLEWAKTQTGKIQFNPEPIELRREINEVINLCRISARQKQITIEQELPEQLPVFADKLMIHTVLRNLVSNAVKFTKPFGNIRISASQSEGQVVVQVDDNGIGIQKDHLEELFNIDSNCSKPGTRDEKGTGLGLLLCDEFIKMHQGKIGAESEIGKGSRFYISLPINRS
ncbi:MAG: PAS domain-containing sensor histidine kinase [Bacteroidales bacterium]|jgi:PAS domain S-box-containing protein|nr:PAS domain-containing sensor histidine kinase [Bacteroidales bacterium]